MSNELTTTENQTPVAQKSDRELREAVYKKFGTGEVLRLNVAMVKNMLVKPTKQGHLPSDTDCFKFIALCKARGLDPWEGDAYMVGYDGPNGPEFSMITAEQAFLKRAEANEKFKGMEGGVIVRTEADEIVDRVGAFMLESDVLLGAWAIVHKTGDLMPVPARINLKGYSKNTRFWTDSPGPAVMIVKCAKAAALREAFPSTLGGLYTMEDKDSGQVIDVPADRQTFVPPKFGAPPQPALLEASKVSALPQQPQSAPEAELEPMPRFSTVPEPALLSLEPPAEKKRGPGRPPKATSSAATPSAATATPPQPAPKAATIQQQLADALEGVPFEDFRGWLVTTGNATKELAATFTGYLDVSDSICEKLCKDVRSMGRIITLYGPKQQATP